MTNEIDPPTAHEIYQWRQLRAFAQKHGESAFAMMCTAAIDGELWAMAGVEATRDCIEVGIRSMTRMPIVEEIAACEALRLRCIRAADATRPGNAIARRPE